MRDRTKLALLVGLGVLLSLVSLAYDPLLRGPLARYVETAARRQHYENVIRKKGLPLHEGVYWKKE